MRDATSIAARAALLGALLAACAAPVDVVEADVRTVYREVTAFALDADGISDDTQVTLARADLEATWETEPVECLRRLHALALRGDRRERLSALAELSFLAGERTGDRAHYLASAAYAHLFLFGRANDGPPGPFRRRFRRAADLHNVALAQAFTDDDGEFVPAAGRVPLPSGAIDVEVPAPPLRVDGFAYEDLRPAIRMDVQGFRARNVRSGVGAPLVARRRSGTVLQERRSHLAPGSAIAVTALLRFDGDLEQMTDGSMRARMEFHFPTGVRDVEIAGATVPVEFDTTAPLAWELSESRPWEKEVSAFLDKDEAGVDNAVVLTEPYRKGRIPVVFVHGTASSPSRWAEVLNELHADGGIAENFQFWLYQYGSGAPILASAAGLRRGLARVARDVDPKGEDPALRQMVVVGHSQGGLLTRLSVTASGDRFWGTVSERPFEEFGFTDSERKYVGPVFFFEPSPHVTRAVFVATPHAGSYVAGNWIGKIGASLVSVPKSVAKGAKRLARRAVGGSALDLSNFSTAVDDMSPGSPFLAALAASPAADGVPLHSIVAVDGAGPVTEGDDGVVQYVSAHLPQAASEIVVRNDHSCQGHPATVAEIRRILHEHLRACGR